MEIKKACLILIASFSLANSIMAQKENIDKKYVYGRETEHDSRVGQGVSAE